MNMWKRCAITIVIGAILAATQSALAQLQVEEKVVGPSAAGTEGYMVSVNGIRYAVITAKGARKTLIVDGVEGPEFDVFLTQRGHPGTPANMGIVFSPDGSRYAYFAAVGNQYILVVDGKEMARGELTPSNIGYSDMTFSPRGKHVYFVDLKPGADGRAKAQLVMDGRPGPLAGHQNIFPVFSPDETRWAYNAQKYGGRPDEFISVVDGKEVPFVGFEPFFTGDNKLVSSLQARPGDPAAVAIDGKSAVPGVSAGGKIGAAPVGARWAGVVQPKKPGDPNVLYIDGKAVPEAQNVEEVIFSPDGRRYMAICHETTTRAKYVVIDGKKGPAYQSLVANSPRFTPDSSKAIYIGNNLGKNFVVVEGLPSDGYLILLGQAGRIAVSQKGGHYGYVASSGATQTLIVDGKPVALDGKMIVGDTLGFSADGSRYAYVATRPPNVRRLFVNGVEVPDIVPVEFGASQLMRDWWFTTWGIQAKSYVFSADGRHVAFSGTRMGETRTTLFVDGKPLFPLPVGKIVSFPVWTPDSKHLFYVSDETSKERPQSYSRVFVDGKATPVRLFDFRQPVYPGSWQMTADGALQVLVFEGAAAKRYRIKPGPETIDTALAGIK